MSMESVRPRDGAGSDFGAAETVQPHAAIKSAATIRMWMFLAIAGMVVSEQRGRHKSPLQSFQGHGCEVNFPFHFASVFGEIGGSGLDVAVVGHEARTDQG